MATLVLGFQQEFSDHYLVDVRIVASKLLRQVVKEDHDWKVKFAIFDGRERDPNISFVTNNVEFFRLKLKDYIEGSDGELQGV